MDRAAMQRGRVGDQPQKAALSQNHRDFSVSDVAAKEPKLQMVAITGMRKAVG
jgi:hypothetical protein